MNWHLRRALMAGALGLVTGCSGMTYAMDTYRATNPVSFASQGKVWRIFDKPQDNIMMITPSLGDAAGAGIVEGMTLGLSGDQTAPVTHFRKAASDYLAATGRRCSLTSTREVIDSQWEFTYDCVT